MQIEHLVEPAAPTFDTDQTTTGVDTANFLKARLRLAPGFGGVMTIKSPLPVGFDRLAAARGLPPLATLQQEMDRLFEGFARAWQGGPSRLPQPSMDLSESAENIEITVELPWLEEQDVEVSSADTILTIRGEKRSRREETDADCRLIGRSDGWFARTVELPAGVDAGAIRAEMLNGCSRSWSRNLPPALGGCRGIKRTSDSGH